MQSASIAFFPSVVDFTCGRGQGHAPTHECAMDLTSSVSQEVEWFFWRSIVELRHCKLSWPGFVCGTDLLEGITHVQRVIHRLAWQKSDLCKKTLQIANWLERILRITHPRKCARTICSFTPPQLAVPRGIVHCKRIHHWRRDPTRFFSRTDRHVVVRTGPLWNMGHVWDQRSGRVPRTNSTCAGISSNLGTINPVAWSLFRGTNRGSVDCIPEEVVRAFLIMDRNLERLRPCTKVCATFRTRNDPMVSLIDLDR